MHNVLEYLENAARERPTKTAVSMKSRSYSFEQLRSKARGMGQAILSSVSGENRRPVLVIADRDISTIAYFFGVLYSGNYYVPVDPDMPESKIQSIFNDCHPIAVLGDEPFRTRFSGFKSNCPYLSESNAMDDGCVFPVVGDYDPLYLIYTSGSTGKPKGVLKSHRQELSFIEAYCRTFDFSEDEVIGNQTPFFFDASAKDIYMMLRLGCALEILPASLFSLPPELIDYLNDKQVTFISWVPTALSLVARLNPFSVVLPTTLRRVFFVGEVMPMKHLNKWRKALPDLQYVNLYGQTEIAGICAFHEVKEFYEDKDVLPIGKPLENCKIYLVNDEKVISEPNRIGEIHVVSDALATEYYQDPEKTNQTFVNMDFGDGPVRCLKTGDLASYDPSGNLVFAARSDFQIKHMGHRIELGEIEAVAGSLPSIDRCCCLYNADKRKIVLVCQPAAGQNETPLGILQQLRDKLSSYMLPNKVIIQEKLPINANGKIDRQTLKAMI